MADERRRQGGSALGGHIVDRRRRRLVAILFPCPTPVSLTALAHSLTHSLAAPRPPLEWEGGERTDGGTVAVAAIACGGSPRGRKEGRKATTRIRSAGTKIASRQSVP